MEEVFRQFFIRVGIPSHRGRPTAGLIKRAGGELGKALVHA